MSDHVLHLGDCLQGLAGLASKSVDHVITDPPYSRDLYLKFRTNKGASSLSRMRRRGSKKRNSTPAYAALANEAIGAADDVAGPAAAEMMRLAKRWIVVFHDAESGHLWRERFGDWHVRCGVWIKTNPMPQISADRPGQGFESIEIAHSPGMKRWNGGGHAAVWTASALQGTFLERAGHTHPCPKPLGLMEALVAAFTEPGDLVCDPFAGSGTTAIACKQLGRRFVGWERNPEWHASAVIRLEAARQQYELLPRPPKAKQARLLP